MTNNDKELEKIINKRNKYRKFLCCTFGISNIHELESNYNFSIYFTGNTLHIDLGIDFRLRIISSTGVGYLLELKSSTEKNKLLNRIEIQQMYDDDRLFQLNTIIDCSDFIKFMDVIKNLGVFLKNLDRIAQYKY